MNKQWQVKSEVPVELVNQFPEIPPLLLQLLYNRGLVTEKDISKFLNPKYEELHSPFLFKDMQKATERIWQAIEQNEKILVYSDYDADAVTANAVLQQTFRYLGVAVESYVPDRFTEGYGLNLEAFRKISAEGVKVVITVDCGTNSLDAAEFCKTEGIDLIITDHHEITGAIPQAYALINPKNLYDKYPDNQITGVGVAYKLAKAILSDKLKVIAQIESLVPSTSSGHSSTYVDEWDKWLLDLVAIGTVADCHSLLGENRILVHYGLKVLAKTKWLGLRQLLETAGLDFNNLDTYSLGFIIAPRINAAGRLEHANVALHLLLAEDFAQAVVLSGQLEQINKRRKDLTGRIVSEAKAQAELILDRKILMVSGSDWPKGVVGIVAGRLAEAYRRPVVVLERGENESTGSARSVGSFNLVECFRSSEHLLVKYGGHKQAAGLTLRSENLDLFYTEILKFADTNLIQSTENFLELEAELSEEDLSLETVKLVEKLAPFGADNPQPKFLIKNAKIMSYRKVGTSGQHVQVKIAVGEKIVDGIGFNLAYAEPLFSANKNFDLAVEPMADSWNGAEKLKLKIIDIKDASH